MFTFEATCRCGSSIKLTDTSRFTASITTVTEFEEWKDIHEQCLKQNGWSSKELERLTTEDEFDHMS